MQGYSSSDLKAPVFGAELANGSPNFGALQTLMIQRQRPQRTSIYDLDHESVVIVLQYLRATDLCSVSETDRSVFNQLHLQKAAIYQITHIYNVFTASITNPDMFKDKDRDSDRDRDSSSNYSSTPPKLSHSMSSPPGKYDLDRSLEGCLSMSWLSYFLLSGAVDTQPWSSFTACYTNNIIAYNPILISSSIKHLLYLQPLTAPLALAVLESHTALLTKTKTKTITKIVTTLKKAATRRKSR